MSEDTIEKTRAQVYPVFFNGVKIGNASNEEKAVESIERLVIAFFNPGAQGILGKIEAWTRMAKSFGYDLFDEDVMRGGFIAGDAAEFRYQVENLQ